MYPDEIYKAHDKDDDVFCLYLEFSKAFDWVQHSTLLNKLRSFGIGGILLRLLASHITNREQCVRAESCLSSWASVSSGVPQGSILGPLLFLVFFNDLPSADLSSSYLFADDGNELNNDLQTLQNDVQFYLNWATINSMLFNVSKTQFLSVGKTKDHCSIYILGVK